MDLENWSKNAPEEPEKLCPLLFVAAAHFLELSELHNLQHISTEHYDCFVEHFVSLGFDQKRESKEFTIMEKLQVMQSIAEELPVSFDVKKLELKLWPTSETEYDMFGKALKKQVQLTVPSSSKPKYDKMLQVEEKTRISWRRFPGIQWNCQSLHPTSKTVKENMKLHLHATTRK
jgi:hypothetical protein